jgi:hypothetical protein
MQFLLENFFILLNEHLLYKLLNEITILMQDTFISTIIKYICICLKNKLKCYTLLTIITFVLPAGGHDKIFGNSKFTLTYTFEMSLNEVTNAEVIDQSKEHFSLKRNTQCAN